jgi:hypothetical protein
LVFMSSGLAYKPEHAVDLDIGAILAAEVHPGDAGDTQTLEDTLEVAATNLGLAGNRLSNALLMTGPLPAVTVRRG